VFTTMTYQIAEEPEIIEVFDVVEWTERAVTQIETHLYPIGASELGRRIGASQLVRRGASQLVRRGSSEIVRRGASQLVRRGGSELVRRGGSELVRRGGSELGRLSASELSRRRR